MYDKLVAEVDNIDTSDFELKTTYNTDKAELQNKIPDVSNLVKKTKLTELENKIPDLSNLATKTGLTTVENKIPLVKKTEYNTKVTEIENKLNDHNHDKYINNQEFNKLAADVFNARFTQTNLITKQILMLSCRVLSEKLLKIKQNIYFLKMNRIS